MNPLIYMDFVVGVTGKRRSGKTLATEHISRKYGFETLDYTRDVLLPLLVKSGKAISRFNLADMAMSLRRDSGNDILTRMLCERIRPGKNYVIGGIRFPEEVEYLRTRFGQAFRLISIVSSDKFRHQRAVSDPAKVDEATSFEKFIQMEDLPTERPIPDTMALADFTIVNEGTVKELEGKVDGIMEQIVG
jgi:dephospho-CoA kinase